MYKYLCLLSCLVTLKYISCNQIEKHNANETWEILIFVQRWLQTACVVWKQTNINHTCAFPSEENSWNVHGIWPNKIGKKEGPNFCNKSISFDENELQPIKNDLEQYWMNIENNTGNDSLWKHEWLKHGSCCSLLPSLNKELTYFGQGLKWLEEFNMTDILASKNIVPNNVNGYNVTTIHQAIVDTLDKGPMIQCDTEKSTKHSLLIEIRICFNKTLHLVDCSILKNGTGQGLLTNCDLKKEVFYLDGKSATLTAINKKKEQELQYSKLLSIYKVLQFLIWITL
ncbi:ribonuclease Oy [Agrilus planipennis]|uniref:Ribonuclease Oy n=1 Tax=Agrilus planipennis TaxID=224129 RepID=A0A1W4X0F2_AGRPL|nr:ribonuclease Oy [Agrilus planipennis]